MSHQASHWALEQSCATATEKAILMVLASYVGADGSCYPGQDTIARQACCSVKSVERALQAFEERGWLARTPRRRKDGSRTSDLLELKLAPNPEPREQADTVSDRPEPTRHLVHTNPTSCPNQPDTLSGLTTFEPVRTEPVREPVRARERAENDNLPSFALSGEPSKTKPAKTRAAKFVPDGWAPNPAHIAKAANLGVDLAQQVELFRNHEYAVPKTDFDRAFHTWLQNAAGRFASRPVPRGRDQGWDPMQQAIDGMDFNRDDAA